jgi:hypothetical protein
MAKGFDNAYTKMVRALAGLNQDFSKELTSEDAGVKVEILPDGSGTLWAVDDSRGLVEAHALFDFSGLDQLMEYLEAGPLKRTLMSQKI